MSLGSLMPDTQDQRDALLDVYFANFDPVIRITHRPTLVKKFSTYCEDLHPMAFAIFYSAINSLPATVVESRFGDSREELMGKFELGIEIGLARGNYLTSPSLEILQAFIIWLTCITREEDMGTLESRNVSARLMYLRQSMGSSWNRHTDSARPRITSRSIFVPTWHIRLSHGRATAKVVAPDLLSRIQIC